MRMRIMSLGILFFFALTIGVVPATSYAQPELGEGMTQGQFAMWLVKAIGASSKLPPAANEDDAVTFLTKLGVIPEGGWDSDATVTPQFLAELVGDSDLANLSFDELVEKVREHVQNLFDETTLGVFRAASSGSGSLPA